MNNAFQVIQIIFCEIRNIIYRSQGYFDFDLVNIMYDLKH